MDPVDQNCVNVYIPIGKKVPLSGSCNLSVSFGSVKILGAVLKAGCKAVDVIAPLSSNQVLIEIVSGESLAMIKPTAHFSESAQKFLESKSREKFAVLRVKPISSSKSLTYRILETEAAHEGRHLQPRPKDSAAVKFLYAKTGVLIGSDDRPTIEIWPQLEESLTAIARHSMQYDLESNTSSSRPCVIMVCGEKSAGKSTTCRAIINSLLSLKAFQEKGVAYLECDVGQTEFTPSAVVSWSLIKDHLLEPPFMHMHSSHNENFIATFYGDLSPGQSPNRYFECIKRVYTNIPSDISKNVPLVVNTMGWMKSLGLALLIDAYRLVQPDIVLHLRTEQDNSPELTPEFFATSDGINTRPYNKMGQHLLLDVKVQRRVSAGRPGESQPPPFFLRALSTAGYLVQCNEVLSSMNLSELPKCEVGSNGYIFVGICHERVPASETKRAIIGSLVALCKIDVKMPPGYSAPQFLMTLPNGWIGNEFLGLGIVLDVDENQRKMTVATPLANRPELLKSVNCILRGLVTIANSTIAQVVPDYLRQPTAPPIIQNQKDEADREDNPFDAQRFGGRRDYNKRKRGIQPAGTNSRSNPNPDQ